MVIAFWNINNNTDLGDILVDFVKENNVDILLLAESQANLKGKIKHKVDDIILDFITKIKSQISIRDYKVIPNADFRIKIISSLSPTVFTLKSHLIKSSRWSAFYVEIPTIIKFNLFPVHFYSKVNWSEISLALECVNLSRDISIVEEHTKCENSILIGDFNMSPFEPGMVAANGINAIQDLNYIEKNFKGREIDGTFYKYFYNPMWNFFGDNNIPFGTLYCRPSGHVSHEWYMYDQVIIRPELKKHIDKHSFKIITNISGQSLLKEYNRPHDKYSDHFPIIFDLKI